MPCSPAARSDLSPLWALLGEGNAFAETGGLSIDRRCSVRGFYPSVLDHFRPFLNFGVNKVAKIFRGAADQPCALTGEFFLDGGIVYRPGRGLVQGGDDVRRRSGGCPPAPPIFSS